jgi:hypothetical protein
MRGMNRWEQPLRGATTLQDQINRMFSEGVGHAGEESAGCESAESGHPR